MKQTFRKRFGIVMCAVLMVSMMTGCQRSSSEEKVSKQGFYFDTIIQITLYGTSDGSYIDECFKLAKKYEDLFSNTISTS